MSLSLLVVFSLLLTMVDRWLHSPCGWSCGYTLQELRLLSIEWNSLPQRASFSALIQLWDVFLHGIVQGWYSLCMSLSLFHYGHRNLLATWNSAQWKCRHTESGTMATVQVQPQCSQNHESISAFQQVPFCKLWCNLFDLQERRIYNPADEAGHHHHHHHSQSEAFLPSGQKMRQVSYLSSTLHLRSKRGPIRSKTRGTESLLLTQNVRSTCDFRTFSLWILSS